MMKQRLKAILEQQDEEGLFPTYRTKKRERIIESESAKIKNIGIHTFVLEKLIDLYPENSIINSAFQNGLKLVTRDSIEYNGIQLWKWLKNPTSEDYLYPPDYDDIARARVMIELAKTSGFELDNKFLEFPFESILEDGLSEDGGIYIFVGDKKRTNDRIDPMVNANILYSLVMHLQKRNIPVQKSKVAERISDYLSKIINSVDYFNCDFENISRFYLSHNLFGYVISRTQRIEPMFDGKMLDKVRKKIENQKGQYNNPLEAALATSALINLGGNKKLIVEGKIQIQQSMKDSYLWGPEPFYQHRRLGHLFGSSAGTSIFCIEALEKQKS